MTTLARAYTRGQGFTGNAPNDEIAAVITTASARLAANGSQIRGSATAGVFVQDLRSARSRGWTLAELAVLNRYRKRAM